MLKEFFDKLSFKPDPIRIYSAGISDVGQRRKLNEDNFLIDEQLGLFIVADGMGGHEAGEIASKLAIETIFNHIKKLDKKQQSARKNNTSQSSPDDDMQRAKTDLNSSDTVCRVLQDAIEEANNQTHCYNIAKGLPEGKGMGTTVTGFWISALKKQLYTFNVGDSRTYRFRQGKLKQLSTDHSHYQLWLETGKEGPSPTHNIIYKAIGPWRRIVAEQHILSFHSNELYLLCSDGLSDMLSDKEIQDILNKKRTASLKEITRTLVAAANDAGGKDNITVVIAKP